MKKLKTLLLIITIPIIVFGQSKNLKIVDKNLSIIQDNIFRINLTQAVLPNYETGTISGVYERRIKSAFSFVGKIGIGGELKKFGPPGDPNQLILNRYQDIFFSQEKLHIDFSTSFSSFNSLNDFSSWLSTASNVGKV